MSELSAFPKDSGSEPQFYKRLSGFAIAGFAAGAFFAICLAVQTALGLHRGEPVLLHPVIQAVPVAGIILSLIALLVISRSEGTLAGRWLALSGMWLSLVAGLGYYAYYGATYMAVRQQADEFVNRYFKDLAAGKTTRAFLQTQDPAIRSTVNPDDIDAVYLRFNQPLLSGSAKGMLDIFRATEYIRSISNCGEVEITPLGVTDLDYKAGAYKVGRLYRVATPAVVFEVHVIALGTESARYEFEGRQWNIVFPECGVRSTNLTRLGTQVTALRQQASEFAQTWIYKLFRKELTAAFLDTQKPEEREKIRGRFILLYLSGALASASCQAGPVASFALVAPAADNELARDLYLTREIGVSPDYIDYFHRAGILDIKQFRPTDNAARDVTLQALRELFAGTGASPPIGGIFVSPESSLEGWQKTSDNRLISPHDLDFVIMSKERRDVPTHTGAAIITVESNAGALDGATPSWRISRFELTRAYPGVPGMGATEPGPAKPQAPAPSKRR
jgi:hypothetical protein